jgi:hypothetical protein
VEKVSLTTYVKKLLYTIVLHEEEQCLDVILHKCKKSDFPADILNRGFSATGYYYQECARLYCKIIFSGGIIGKKVHIICG